MISRYTRPEMKQVWTDENRFSVWLEVELAVLETLAEDGVIPRESVEYIRKTAQIKTDRILEVEEEVKHDVIAFTTSIAEQTGEHGRFFHYGLTSSDVVDTALALLMIRAGKLIKHEMKKLLNELEAASMRTKNLVTIGRTHGMHAEPTVFGLKFLSSYCEFRRQYKNIKRVIKLMSRGKLSGAVGIYGALSPDVEERALGKLGLKPEPVSTQIMPRDRHADFLCVLAQIGASVERLALELRHLQRSEVNEVEEEFTAGQKGSSAMPHKKNPISAENLTGCARLLRGYGVTALENVALWHERDISHSSAERVILPDATTLAHYMIHRLTKLVKGLVINEDQVARNLGASQGVYFSGHVLLALVQKGETRENAYKLLQKAAHEALRVQQPLMDVLWNRKEVREKFSQQEYKKLFDLKRLTHHVDRIYERVLNDRKIPQG